MSKGSRKILESKERGERSRYEPKASFSNTEDVQKKLPNVPSTEKCKPITVENFKSLKSL